MRSVPNRFFLIFLPPHCFLLLQRGVPLTDRSSCREHHPPPQPCGSPGASPQPPLPSALAPPSLPLRLPLAPLLAGPFPPQASPRPRPLGCGAAAGTGDTGTALTRCERPGRHGSKARQASVGATGREQGQAGSSRRQPLAGAQGDGNVPPVPRKLCGHERCGHTSALGSVARRGSVCGRWSREGCVRSCRSSGKEDLQSSLDKGSLLSPRASHKPCTFSSGHLGH